jgi:phage terminase large subunit
LNINYFIAGVDVGYTNPTAMLAIGITRDKKAYVVEEYYEKEQNTDVTVEVIKGWNQKYNFKRIYADPSAADWISKADTQRLPAVEGDNDLDKGVAKIKSFFGNDIIFIDRNCEFLLKELESYQYDKGSVNSNESEKPMKKNDHAVDAMRYAFTEFNPWRKDIAIFGGRRKSRI